MKVKMTGFKYWWRDQTSRSSQL